MKSKSNAMNVFLLFIVFVENQFNLSIKALQSNWGEEYWHFLPILQHGRAEHKHRHVVECGLTLLVQAQLPLHF